VGRAFGSSPGDVGVTVIGTTSTNRIPGVPEAGVFGSLRVGEVSVSAAGGGGLGEGTGVVIGVSLPPFTVTRGQLGALLSR